MRGLLLLLFACLLSSPACATSDVAAWQSVRVGEFRSDTSTWSREVPGNPLKAFRGEVELPYSMLEVLAVLADIDNYPRWIYQCDYAWHFRSIADDVVYVRIKGIGPVDDRDVLTRTRLTQDPETLRITVHSWAVQDLYPSHPSAVRMPELENLFILEPLRDDWTRVTFQTFADPGGWIPDWVANMVARNAPRDTLDDLKKRLRNKRYHISEVAELPFLLPGLAQMRFPAQQPRADSRVVRRIPALSLPQPEPMTEPCPGAGAHCVAGEAGMEGF